MTKNTYFIIDFDSTFTQVEAFDELCHLCYPAEHDKIRILKEVKSITGLGMEGKLSIAESLERRLLLLNAHQSHLQALIEVLKRKVSVSFEANRDFLYEQREHIFIVSNGFMEFIAPVVTEYGIKARHIFANSFEYDTSRNITGFNKQNCLAGEKGKVEQVKQLNLDGRIIVIGDGYTDYEIEEAGLAQRFYAFTENVSRPAVTSKTKFIANSLDHILDDLGIADKKINAHHSQPL
jgi:D-3-phosphoglycerate dehydrogenase